MFRVIVLDDGKVIECGDVETLKNDEKSIFGGMVKKSDEIQNYLK